MLNIIVALLSGGILAGLIQFFVDYKKLPIYNPATGSAESVNTDANTGWFARLLQFVKDHWQFFGYLTIGIAGAMLVPLINELMPAGLAGLQNIKNPSVETSEQRFWSLLVLVGYGVVLGYSAVRLLRSLGSLIVDRISKSQQEQEVSIEKLKKELADLKANIPTGQQAATNSGEGDATPNNGDDEHAFAETSTANTLEAAACVETPKPWKDWRMAQSLAVLRQTINTLAPDRSKLSDGSIGDLKHQQTNSDHNPWVRDGVTNRGVVTAIDITHDAAHGCDCNRIAESLAAAQDPRVKYVIWNRKIMNSSAINGSAPWTWRAYSGANPHNKHIHISVKCDKDSYDSSVDWMVAVK